MFFIFDVFPHFWNVLRNEKMNAHVSGRFCGFHRMKTRMLQATYTMIYWRTPKTLILVLAILLHLHCCKFPIITCYSVKSPTLLLLIWMWRHPNECLFLVFHGLWVVEVAGFFQPEWGIDLFCFSFMIYDVIKYWFGLCD